MRKFLLSFLTLLTLSLACEAQSYCLTAPIGYGRSATGGTGKAITLVTNQTELQNAIKNGNGIYIITTNITVSMMRYRDNFNAGSLAADLITHY